MHFKPLLFINLSPQDHQSKKQSVGHTKDDQLYLLWATAASALADTDDNCAFVMWLIHHD